MSPKYFFVYFVTIFAENAHDDDLKKNQLFNGSPGMEGPFPMTPAQAAAEAAQANASMFAI